MQTILVVDNEAPIRKLLAQVLKKEGYKVLAAGDGEEALATAAKSVDPIDLLVTDIVMPGMGGTELYAWLKSHQPGVKVIFISGFMEREPLEAAFLKKPFLPAALVEKVREVLSHNAGGIRQG